MPDVHHRPDFHRAPVARRDLARDFDRLVQVVGFDQEVAAQLLARLGERAIVITRLPSL